MLLHVINTTFCSVKWQHACVNLDKIELFLETPRYHAEHKWLVSNSLRKDEVILKRKKWAHPQT